jgi:hypothetical protein
MQAFKNRDPLLIHRLHQLYKVIGRCDVMKSGQFYVDTDIRQTNIYFVDRINGCMSEFPSYLADDQIELLFDIIDIIFKQGIKIGLRESFKIILTQLGIQNSKDKREISNTKLLSYSIEGILNAYFSVTQGCRINEIRFSEPLAFEADNPELVTGVGDIDSTKTIFSKLDASFAGDGKYYDFTPENLIELLNELGANPVESVLDVAAARRISSAYS